MSHKHRSIMSLLPVKVDIISWTEQRKRAFVRLINDASGVCNSVEVFLSENIQYLYVDHVGRITWSGKNSNDPYFAIHEGTPIYFNLLSGNRVSFGRTGVVPQQRFDNDEGELPPQPPQDECDWTDISHERSREYHYDKDFYHEIQEPKKLKVLDNGGHIIEDGLGYLHELKKGWRVLIKEPDKR